MIEQQYYTFSEKGQLWEKVGYDTISKSENMMVFTNLDNGSILFSSTALIANKENSKSEKFFFQEYLVTNENADFYIKHMERIIYASGISESSSLEDGKYLSRISELPYLQEEDIFDEPSKLFAGVGLDSESFSMLIYAVFLSIKNDKKIVIALELSEEEFIIYSKGLLKFIYTVLPYKLRKKIGFVSNSDIFAKIDGISITIIKKGNIDTELYEDYLFYMEDGKLINNQFETSFSPFIKYVCRNLNSNETIYKFLDIADKLISLRVMEIEEYNKLIHIFNNLSFLGQASPKAVEDNSFIKEAQDKIMELVRKEKDKYYTVDAIYTFLDCFSKEYPIKEYKGRYQFLCDVLKYNIHKYVFNTIDILTIGREDILRIHLREEDEDDDKYIIINAMQRIINSSDLEIDDISKYIAIQNEDILYYINTLVKDYYSSNISVKSYPFILLGFISGLGQDNRIQYNFNSLFDYVAENQGEINTAKLIVWLSDEFKGIRYQEAYTHFIEALNIYFIQKHTNFFNIKEARKTLLEIKNVDVRETIDRLRIESAKGIKKLAYALIRKK